MTDLRYSFTSEAARTPLVLIAEDDDSAADLLQTLLERAGYQVRIARDGAEALRLVEAGMTPDVLLLDWMLPEMTGLEVCRRIRESYDPLMLPILVVTAKTDPQSVGQAFEAGASDYIMKPFLGAELRARVAAHLRVKMLSEERRQLDEHLMERDKLSTLGLLVGGVAHDLNNPLGGIYGYAQLLLEEETDPDRVVALQRIVSEVQRCNRIVADLLSFGRRHAAERGEVDIAEVLASTLDLREKHLRSRGVVAHLKVAENLPLVCADAHQLQQVFLNLLVNAEHALRSGGSDLRIVAERAPDPAGRVEWLAVHFFNDGPLIPIEIRHRIFDPFFTTKSKEEGTGLGLAICRRIAREHGGDIEFTSGERGTTFTVLLPPDRPESSRGSDRLAG